ncbi:MAG: tetratricopeptide repeat protein [Bacteroidota bacterium]
MRPVHYITIVAALVLLAALYWGGNTIPPAKTGNGATPPMAAGVSSAPAIIPASFDSMLSAARTQVPEHATTEISNIEKQIAAIHDSTGMAPLFTQLAQLWKQHKQLTIAAYYVAKAAKLENSEKKLTFAAQYFLDRMSADSSERVQMWEAEQSIECFQRALQINPENDSAQIGLAKGLVITGQTMQGVQLLRGITQKDSNNVPANMLLGQLAIQSGQFDKAIKRFETILRVEPANAEALYSLAEAFKGKGDKAKAIELFEQCKKLVDKPEFSRDIDKYINSFR